MRASLLGEEEVRGLCTRVQAAQGWSPERVDRVRRLGTGVSSSSVPRRQSFPLRGRARQPSWPRVRRLGV